MTRDKSLVIIRGVQGSGKSTLALMYQNQGYEVFEADMYFMNLETGKYEWVKEKIGAAHLWCQDSVRAAMSAGKNIVVSNTSVRRKDLKPYLTMATGFGYSVQEIICKGRFKNNHGVSDEVVEQKLKDFEY